MPLFLLIMEEIYDINDERISPFLNLKFKNHSLYDIGYFIADSNKTVLRLLNSNYKILKLLITEEFYYKNQHLILSKIDNDSNILLASKSIMTKIVGFKLHGGVMALAEIPKQTQLSSLDNLILVMNNIIDAENVGSIIRNSAAFNIHSIISDVKTPHPYLRRVVRVSMGNIFNMKYYISQSLLKDLNELKELGYKIISIENNVNSKNYLDIKYLNKLVLIFGNEGKGIDKELLDISDEVVHISIEEEVNSINVSAASAIILNHIYNTI